MVAEQEKRTEQSFNEIDRRQGNQDGKKLIVIMYKNCGQTSEKMNG